MGDRTADADAVAGMEQAGRFTVSACMALPRIRAPSAAAALGGASPTDSTGPGQSSQEFCLAALDAEMAAALRRVHRVMESPAAHHNVQTSVMPWLSRLVSALSVIDSPRAYHEAVRMLSRFKAELPDPVGDWLWREFDRRNVCSS